MNTPEVYTVYVEPKHITCPHCQKQVTGWMSDPRGHIDICEHCKKQFTVAIDATLVMDY